MSRALVTAAHGAPVAFDPTPLPESLPFCHVPMRDLVGDDLEGRIAERLLGYGRVALVGPTGCGKSSVARYLLAGTDRLAPLWINVATEDHARIASPRGFYEVLIAQLAAAAAAANRLSADERQDLLQRSRQGEHLGRRDTRTRIELGGSYWLLRGRLAREVVDSLDHGEAYRPIADLRVAAGEVLAAIAAEGLVPVLVCDDTDRLLGVGEVEQRQTLFDGFFGEVVRELSELEAALILSAHDRYAVQPGYRAATQGLLEGFDVPSMTKAEQFARVVDARLAFVDEVPGAGWADLVAGDVLDGLLLAYHEQDRSLRRTLSTLRGAIALAAGDGADRVELRHLDAALAG